MIKRILVDTAVVIVAAVVLRAGYIAHSHGSKVKALSDCKESAMEADDSRTAMILCMQNKGYMFYLRSDPRRHCGEGNANLLLDENCYR
jgi:hypothetical protein